MTRSSIPGHYNRSRIIGEVATVHKLITGTVKGCMVHVHTGDEAYLAVVAGKTPLPSDLKEGDLVDVTGEIGAARLSRRQGMFYLACEHISIIPPLAAAAQNQ